MQMYPDDDRGLGTVVLQSENGHASQGVAVTLPMMDRKASRSWSDIMPGYWHHMARAQAAWPQQNDDETDF